ncbi:universal stress protein [Natronorubrum sp. JWXQ-INN-674]|uniref:Universal stress protein n=1 Tax=Natronorubrum halalkaliphilum TaxID=2691917 RepID=A0A6B0VQW9_9EURY|nr:universal stress protein [Natronorubrum halalkaliphilum]MXV63457.1 universal stress protein [Natronorubrum halalkaliphilum]
MSGDRLLVPVANPETADRLLDTAIDVARDRDLEILVLHVVGVPMQLSLEQARRSMDVEEGESVVEYAVDRTRQRDVSVTGRVRFGRDVAGSVLSVAEQEDVETILLGWRGRPRRRDVILGSYIDEVLANAPCDVLVKRIDREGGDVSSVLVPVAGGPHTEYAAEIAGSLARGQGASVELVTVVSPDADEEAVADGRSLLTRTSPALGAVESVGETVLRGDDVVETIVDRSRDHDVTIIGAAENGLLRRVLVGSVPQAVGREADGAVVMAKRHQGLPKALWRRLRDRL